MPFTTRDATNFNIHVYGAGVGKAVANMRLDTIMVVGGNAGGFFNDGTSGNILTNNGIFNTGADCNYETDGATNTIIDHEVVQNCGDDMTSNVSYVGEPGGQVGGSLVQWNTLQNSVTSRGCQISSINTTCQDNYIANLQQSSGVQISNENEPAEGDVTSPTYNNIVRWNYLYNAAGPAVYHCSLLDLSYTGASYNNDFYQNIINDPANQFGVCTYAEGGTVSNIGIENNVLNTTGLAIRDGDTGGTVSTNIQCSGNTQNGAAVGQPSPPCTAGYTKPSAATGSPLTYSGCMVGTAKQYTGPITINSSTTVKAIAVRPGLTNSSVASGTY